MMKRLYSSFPNGNAALGLVLLRVLTTGAVAEQSRRVLAGLFVSPESGSGTASEIAAASALVAGILMILGLWTSIAAGVLMILGIAAASFGVQPLHSLFLAWLSFAIALVGPGAFSLDARIFGWRQIRFPNGKTQSMER
jgi:uncharacterized membrane protein YphA (DoxX/SURF4 family)